MYSEELVRCNDCNDEIKIIYDSRKDKQDSYECKCGKLTIHNLRPHCGFTYSGSCNVIEESYKYENLDSDYFVLDDELKLLCDVISEIGNSLKRDVGYFSDRCSNDDISFSIWNIDESKQQVNAELYIDLNRSKGWKESEYQEVKTEIIDKLNSFKEFLSRLQNNEISLSKPKELWSDNNLNGTRRQKELYDYNFEF